MKPVVAETTEIDYRSNVDDATHRRRSTTARAIFAACMLAHLAVIWSFRYLPTCDGPAHLASAVTWARLDCPQTRYREFYIFSPKQVPNLTSQFMLAGLVRLMPPLIAEKLLATFYVLGLAAAYWYFVAAFGNDAKWLAPLGLLFLFHRAFLMGLFNYCLSLIAFWYIAGYCARHPTRLGALGALKLAAALMVAYVTHLVGWALSLIAAFWFAVCPRRHRAWNWNYIAAAAAPSSLLALHYGVQTSMAGRNGVPSAIFQALRGLSISQLEQRVASFGANIFGPLGLPGDAFGYSVFFLCEVMIGAAIVSQCIGPRAAGSLRALLFAAFLFAGYFVLPDHLGRHGGLFLIRLVFLPPMLAVGLIQLPAASAARHSVLALVYGLVLVNIASTAHFFRRANADIEEYVAGTDAVGKNAAIFTVFPGHRSYWPEHLWHAACYYCLTTGNIALENFQGAPGPFWIQLREGIAVGGGDFERYPNKSLVDYALVWHDRPIPLNVPAGWQEAFAQGRLRVFAIAGADADQD